MHNLIELIDKFIEIEDRTSKFYQSIFENKAYSSGIRLTAKVLYTDEIKHKTIYMQIKDSLVGKDEILIDYSIYDKAHKIVNSFDPQSHYKMIENSMELTKIARDIENENLALAISVQGILVGNKQGQEAYEQIGLIVDEEKRHLSNIETFIK